MKNHNSLKNFIYTASIILSMAFTLTGCGQEERQSPANPTAANANLPKLDCNIRTQKATQTEQLAKNGQSMQQIYDALTPADASVLEKSENMMLIPPVVDAVQKNKFEGAAYIGEQCEKNRTEYWGYQAQVCAIYSPILKLAVNERDGGSTLEQAREKAAKQITKLIGSADSARNMLAGNVMTNISDQIVRDTYAQPQKTLKELIDAFNAQCMFGPD